MKNEQFMEAGGVGEVIYTIAETCSVLKCSKTTLWRKTKYEGLTQIKSGGWVRYRKKDVDNWVEDHKSGGDSN